MKTRYVTKWSPHQKRWGVYDNYETNWHSYHRTEYMAKRTAAFENADFVKAIQWHRGAIQ